MFVDIIQRLSFTQGLILLATIGLIIDTIVKSWKGRNNLAQDLLFKCVDMYNYFIDEKHGNVVQKINATIAFILFFTSIGAISIIFYKFIKDNKVCYELLPWFISPLVALPITLIFCAKYTRHRY